MNIKILPLILLTFLTSFLSGQTAQDATDAKATKSSARNNTKISEDVIPELAYKDKFGSPRVLINATVRRAEPDGVVFAHESGVTKVRFEFLSKDLREKYGYSPEKAKQYADAVSKKEAVIEREAEAIEKAQREKRAEDTAKTQTELDRKNQAEMAMKRKRAEYANQQAALAEEEKRRATALRAMQRAVRTGDRTDEARAMKLLTSDAPESVSAFTDYLTAKAAARAKASDEAETRRLQMEIDKLRDKINDY